MTDQTTTGWACPKDGIPMEPMGRRDRGYARRCPTCQGIFFDVEGVRQGRAGRRPWWTPVVTSVLVSVLATFLAKRLRRRSPKQDS